MHHSTISRNPFSQFKQGFLLLKGSYICWVNHWRQNQFSTERLFSLIFYRISQFFRVNECHNMKKKTISKTRSDFNLKLVSQFGALSLEPKIDQIRMTNRETVCGNEIFHESWHFACFEAKAQITRNLPQTHIHGQQSKLQSHLKIFFAQNISIWKSDLLASFQRIKHINSSEISDSYAQRNWREIFKRYF